MSESEPTPREVFDLDRLRQLLELMKEFDLSELDLCQGEQQIRLARGGVQEMRMPMMMAPSAPPPAVAPAPASAAGAAAASADGPNIAYIRSPMVGTFYSRPNPKAEPFVKVGSSVTADSVVCIVEAMKVFNEIQAEIRGKIVAVLVDDESPVEFGKPLFKVDTSA